MQNILDRLYQRRTFGIKLGLETEEALLSELGNPHHSFAAIHVAGTNGKGSVCALLASILEVAGIHVGLYTSPHLVSFNERFRIDGEDVGDDDLMESVVRVDAAADTVHRVTGNEPTFFECSTAIAFDLFARRGVQIAVVETGLGGRLDATNVVLPLMSIITRIGLEHTAYLGETIRDIASEKAGIIKRDRPVVCGAMDEVAVSTVRTIARERGCRVSFVPECVSVRRTRLGIDGQTVVAETPEIGYGTLTMPLLGDHQIENLATALAAVDALDGTAGIRISAADVKTGVSRVRWSGRCQLIGRTPPMVLDGAHNPQAAEALADTLRSVFRHQPCGLVLGMCGDKDLPRFLTPFRGLIRRCWAVPLTNERGVDPEEIVRAAAHEGWSVAACTLTDALTEASAWASDEDGVVCVAGSLFLVGDVLAKVAERLPGT